MTKSLEQHNHDVRAIAGRIAELVSKGEPVHISKGGVSHYVPLPNDPRFRSHPVDISPLCRILEIDPYSRICVAEPGISFKNLVTETLKYGLIPTVVPELEDISIGGAVAGCSIEGMSYRYGGFHDSCLEYELITGDGKVRTCSPEKDPTIFGMLHSSYGTLAIMSKITFKLVPAKRFVKLEYRHYATFEQFQREMLARCGAEDYDFIDGIIHSPRQFVLCLGRFADEVPYTSDYRRLNIYYKSTAVRSQDYLTTLDYCFRYDAECHWMTATVPPLEMKPVRWLIGKYFLGSRNMIQWSKRLAPLMAALKRRPEVVCDVFIPIKNFEAFYRWYEKDFDFYPLWIVPYTIPETYHWVSKQQGQRLGPRKKAMIVDCAIYGRPNEEKHVDYSKLLEDKTYELGGVKTLISRNHYSPERFWDIYNKENYYTVKAEVDPQGIFPDFFKTYHRVD